MTKSSSNTSVACLQDRAVEVIDRYGNANKFMLTFAPDKIAAYTRNEVRCYTGKAPSLYWITEAYGREICQSWVEIMIKAIVDKQSGDSGNFINTQQIASIAHWMMCTCKWLTATELMLFVRDYGTFTKDPTFVVNELNIKAQMRGFERHRQARLESIEAEKQRKANEDYQQKIREGKTMSYTEWLEYKKRINEKDNGSNDREGSGKEGEQPEPENQ